eukprot:scaffold72839_cov20-Cyclotella_meneghiniana.AAC.1
MKLRCCFIQILQHSHPNQRHDVDGNSISNFQSRPMNRIVLKSTSQKRQYDVGDIEVTSLSDMHLNRFLASMLGIIPAVFASTAWAHVGIAGAVMSATNTQDALVTIQGRPGDIIPTDHYSTTIMLSQPSLNGGNLFFIGQNQPYYSTIITPSSLYPGESVHSTIITPSSLYPGESVNTNVLSQIPTNILLADESLVGKLLDKAIQALDESEQQSSGKPKPKIKPKVKSKQEQFREEIEARLDADTTAKQ